MASIRDIASRAGVSIATVSRLVNGTASVKKETEERIREALEYYKWQPNQFGRGLRRQSADMIGLYIGNLDGAYMRAIVDGVSSVVMRHGCSLVLIFDADVGENGLPRYQMLAQQKRIDGLIFALPPTDERCLGAMRILSESRFPIVYVGKKATDYGCNVYARYEEYTAAAIRHLEAHGHRRILVYHSPVHSSCIERVLAAVQGLEVKALCMPDGDDFNSFCHRSLEEHVIGGGFTAVCNIETDFLPQFIGQCGSLGLSIPHDVSVVATDNTDNTAGGIYPGFTANLVPGREMGRGACELLFSMIEGHDCWDRTLEFETRLVERNSVRTL